MKVLYVITKSEPFGGAQKYVLEMAEAARIAQHKVIVALGGKGDLYEKLIIRGADVRVIKSFQRNISIFKEVRVFFDLLRLFRKERPDVVHLNSSKAGGIGALSARLARVPKIIFTAHGWEHTAPRPLWQKKLIKLLHIVTVFLSHITIAVSEHTKNELHSIFFQSTLDQKIIVVHNGIDTVETLHPREARKELIERTRLRGSVDLWSTQTLWLGSIAELHPNKGIDLAVKAVERLIPVFHKYKVSLVYFVIGDGDQRKELEEYIQKKRLQSYIFLIGYVENAARYLSAFDTYLLPSRKEGFPFALLEAGSASLPVIATDVGGVTEVIQSGETGYLIKPYSSEVLAEAILEYVQNRQKRISDGEALKQLVEEKFSKTQTLRKTFAIYEG